MTYQIIYSSEAATPMQTDDLEDLLAQARSSNASRGITGALVYGEGVFLQILEGDRLAVEGLMARIGRDVRHHGITMLREGEIGSATFSSWKMAYVAATPQQIAKWAGLDRPEATPIESDAIRERDRTAQFAQEILALLAPADTSGHASE